MDALIKGVSKVGRVVSVDTQKIPQDAIDVTIQWLVNGQPVANAIGTTYLVQQQDEQKEITVQVNYQNAQGQPQRLDSLARTVETMSINSLNRDGASDIRFQHTSPLTNQVDLNYQLDLKATHETGGPQGVLIQEVTHDAQGLPLQNLQLVDSDFRQVVNGRIVEGSLLMDTGTKTLYMQEFVSGQAQLPVELNGVYPVGLSSAEQRASVDLKLISTTFDSDSDGTPNLLWQIQTQNPQGQVQVESLSVGNQTIDIQQARTALGTDIRVLGDRDLSGEGKSDLLLTDSAGQRLFVMKMDGATVIDQGVVVDSAVLPNGQLAKDLRIVDERGDYNNDGRVDILVQNTATGELRQLDMDGRNVLRSLVVDTQGVNLLGSDRVVSGHTDFDGNGLSDLLIEGQDGSTRILLMGGADGNQVIASNVIEQFSDWKVSLIDVSIDGIGSKSDLKSDLVFENVNTRQIATVVIDGVDIAAAPSVIDVPAGWSLAPVETIGVAVSPLADVPALSVLLPTV